MKVAYLFGSLNRGGLETLLLDVCRKLKKTDFDAIAIYRKDGVMKEDFEKTNVPFFFLPYKKNIIAYLFELRKIIREKKVDIIHAQQPIDALFAYYATRGLKIKLILTLHGFGFGGGKLRVFAIKKTIANLYVSHFQKKYYVDNYNLLPARQHVIYNGIDFSKIKMSGDKHVETLRRELGIDKSTLLMGMVGNFNPGRDQLYVCRFLKVLKEKNSDFHFVFVGKRVESSVERYDNCVEFCRENNLADNVSFLGMRNDVPGLLVQLDAFVYATEHDTFGIAVVEAIASGIPVFVNDWHVMREITENDRLANLYKTDDENDLVNKIMLFLRNKEDYVKRAVENAYIVRDKYSIEKHIQDLKNLYSSVLNKGVERHSDAQ